MKILPNTQLIYESNHFASKYQSPYIKEFQSAFEFTPAEWQLMVSKAKEANKLPKFIQWNSNKFIRIVYVR